MSIIQVAQLGIEIAQSLSLVAIGLHLGVVKIYVLGDGFEMLSIEVHTVAESLNCGLVCPEFNAL